MTTQVENFRPTDNTTHNGQAQPEQWNSANLLGDRTAAPTKPSTADAHLPSNFEIHDPLAAGAKPASPETVKPADFRSPEVARVSQASSNSDDDGLPHPGGGYGSYHYGYQFSTSENWSKADIVKEIAQNPNKYFTFTGDKPTIELGETINLKGPLGEKEPVKVVAINDNGFSFESLPGHSEGAGRTIVFRIVPELSPIDGKLNWELHVEAGGHLSMGSLIPGADLGDKLVWQQFDDNLNNRLPNAPASKGPTSV